MGFTGLMGILHVKGNSKNMVKLLKQSSISLHPLKTQGVNVGLQRHNEREPGQRHSKQKYQASHRTSYQYLSGNRKITERMARAGG